MKKKIIVVATLLWFSSVLLLNNTFASVENANYLAEKWIIVNKSKNPSEYRLNKNILRQEVAVVALWIHGWVVENNCRWVFRDVSATKPNSWACKTIEALAKYDIISDDNAYFRPEANITKSEALWMLIEAGLDNEYDFDEDNVYYKGNWQKQVVDFAVSKWIVSRFSDYNTLATRDFIFDVWANILRYKEKNFSSQNSNNNQENSIFNVNNLDRYNSNNNTNLNNNQKEISSEYAKSIALKAANLRESETTRMHTKIDYDDGRKYFEVEFYEANTNKKFDYKIDAITGKIVEFDIDQKKIKNNQNYNSNNNLNNKISQNQAKNIALKNAWLNENQTHWVYIKNDYENWKLYYEVEFYQLNTRKKFEYKIDSTNGNIVESEIDIDND